jgi:putative (di)nucleoside polyphosphate hydrolase
MSGTMHAQAPPGYRPCVGIMIVNRDGKVWIGRRAGSPADAEGPDTWWQMPQGGIDAGEDIEKAALRELAEETGVTSAHIIARTEGYHLYDLPASLQGKAWGGRYRGQAQWWVVVRFTGEDGEIDLEPPGHQVEFDRWEWTPLETLIDRVVPFKRAVYAAVIAELGPHVRPE